ncbi:MAG: hypothetical protein V1707_03210 [bacterium]
MQQEQPSIWHYVNANPNGAVPYIAITQPDEQNRTAWLACLVPDDPLLKEIAARLTREFQESWPIPDGIASSAYFDGLLELFNEKLAMWWKDANVPAKAGLEANFQVGLADNANIYVSTIGNMSSFLIGKQGVVRLQSIPASKKAPQFLEVVSGQRDSDQSFVTLPPHDDLLGVIKEIFIGHSVNDDLSLAILLPAQTFTAPDEFTIHEHDTETVKQPEPETDVLEQTAVKTSSVPRAWLFVLLSPAFRFWQQQTAKQQRIIILSAGCLLLLTGGIVLASQRQIVSGLTEKRQALAGSIRNAQTQAESALLYGDRQKAADLLNQADELIKQLPDQNELTSEQAKLQQQVKKIVTVSNPAVAGILGSGYQQLFWTDKGLIANGPGQKLALLKSNSQQVTTLSNISTASAVSGSDNDQIVSIAKNEATVYDINANTSKTYTVPSLLANARAITSYSNRWYWLDQEGTKIYRADLTDKGFSAPISWIKNNAKLSLPTSSLAVDVSVFLLLDNGAVQKFHQGASQSWKPDQIDPAPAGGKIRTVIGGSSLYIVDPAQQRIIILSKDGQIKKQLVSTSFTNLMDAVPDNLEKNLYVLVGQNIYQIPISQ